MMTCTLPEQRIPLAGLLAFSVLCCVSLAGCSFPKRTFVADEESKPRAAVPEVPARTVEREPLQNPQPRTVAAPAANEEKAFGWSNWLGPFSPKKPEPKPVDPPQRIPLPRTDRPLDERWDAADAKDNTTHSGF